MQSVDDALNHNSNFEIILQYIRISPDEKFGEILNDALTAIENIPEQMQEHAKRTLLDTIKAAEARTLTQKKSQAIFLTGERQTELP